MNTILIYLAIINAVAFLLMLIDKQCAKKRLWRIPEAILLGCAVIGGSVGAIAAMYIFRHKTRHVLFTTGIPFILLLQVFLALLYLI